MRLFVGIALPEETHDRLAMLKGGLKGARWLAPENLHLSLRFIGEITGSMERDIDAALQTVGGNSFSLSLSKLGAFERRGRVHQVWAGDENPEPVAALRDKIDSALVRCWCAPEHRKVKPHVTVARLKGGSTADAGLYLIQHAGFLAGPFTVEKFTLFESHLGTGGAHYVVLADYPLNVI